MTRVVIVGEIYNADLSIGGGPIYPGGGQPYTHLGPAKPWLALAPDLQPRIINASDL